MRRKVLTLVLLLVFPLILSSQERPTIPTDGAGALSYVPALAVQMVASDDTARNTGVMVLGLYPAPGGWPWSSQRGIDLIAHYDITVALNGVPISTDLVVLAVLKKDEAQPVKKSFPTENLKTTLKDVSDKFICMVRWSTLPGIGVMDVYYIGERKREWVDDYLLAFSAATKVGDKYVWGSNTQKLCVLGWSMGTKNLSLKLPAGDLLYTWEDPLGPFKSSVEAVLWQRFYLGLKIPNAFFQ